MTKSELIEALVRKQTQLGYRDVELAVKTMLEHMAQTLASGERIEIRGFGSFSLHYRPPRVGRNPKSGDPVSLPAKHVPHFKPGKELRERVNATDAAIEPAGDDENAVDGDDENAVDGDDDFDLDSYD
jgi:integration host factor subunit beta